MAKFRFTAGPWNVHEGNETFGPGNRKSIPFEEKVAKFAEIGLSAVQFHDDDAVPDLSLNEKQTLDYAKDVKALLDKGLIEAAGRLDAPGRPMLYVTTDKFLRVFGINSLDELPETEALSTAAQAEQLKLELDSQEDAEQTESELGEYTEPVDTEEADVIFENGAEPLESASDIPSQSDDQTDINRDTQDGD